MNTSTELATVLRDFFACAEHFSLAKNSYILAKIWSDTEEISCPHMDEGTEWQKIEADFNRLFIGPEALAPPHATAYLQRLHEESGRPRLTTCAIFYALGIDLSSTYSELSNHCDHLCIELEGWLRIRALITNDYTYHAQRANLRAAQGWLISTHMQAWLPAFITQALQQSHVSRPVRQALHALQYWLQQQTDTGETVQE